LDDPARRAEKNILKAGYPSCRDGVFHPAERAFNQKKQGLCTEYAKTLALLVQ